MLSYLASVADSSGEPTAFAGLSIVMIILFAVVAIIGLAVYFIPTIVALCRKHPNKGAIIVLNIFLGWSFIGWVVSLVMACSRKN